MTIHQSKTRSLAGGGPKFGRGDKRRFSKQLKAFRLAQGQGKTMTQPAVKKPPKKKRPTTASGVFGTVTKGLK